MNKRLRFCFQLGSFACISAIFCPINPAYPQEPEYLVIIVNNLSKHSVASKAELSLIYLRKQKYWNGGMLVQSVNLPSSHSHRLTFSQAILIGSPDSQTDYWNDQYFQGVSPPHIVESQEAAIRFVSSVEGAVGYISACNLDDRVRGVLWMKPDGQITHTKPNLTCPI